jgi:hypothetical protein
VWTIEVFGQGCLGVNDRSIWSGVVDFSALSWESVDVMFVLTISSIFWRGLKIDGVLPFRWVVSGCTPTYRPKVASTCTLPNPPFVIRNQHYWSYDYTKITASVPLTNL